MTKWEMLDITKTKESFADLISNIKPGEEKEAIGQLLTENYGTYIKLKLSETNIYTLDVWCFTDKGSSHTYVFKTQDVNVLEWFIRCNLLAQFDDVLPGPIKGQNGYSIDLNERPEYYVVKYDNMQYCLVSKKNSLEQIVKHFRIEEE